MLSLHLHHFLYLHEMFFSVSLSCALPSSCVYFYSQLLAISQSHVHLVVWEMTVCTNLKALYVDCRNNVSKTLSRSFTALLQTQHYF